MRVTEAEFVGSYTTVTQCPPPDKPEYAFIGRSNVGKSSLINMLCERKNMARTSNRPGKTQLINYFDINKRWYLVDLPGYGYAKISKTKRKEWRKMIENYLLQRTSLACACVLIDCNIPPQQNDLEFLNWLGKVQIPFVLIFTKADRQNKLETVENAVEAFKNEMLKTWEEVPNYFITSSNSGLGQTEILEFIESVNIDFYKFQEMNY